MRGPLAAMLIFVGLLFPALGFVNVYPFIYSFVADHFQYLACIAPLTLLAAGIAEGLDQLEIGRKFGRRLAYALPVLVLGVLTWQQSRQYTDIGTLWRTTIARNPDCWMAYSNLGSLLLARGDLDQAIRDFRKALELWPDQSKDHNNLGNALAQKGRMAEAMEQFQTALKLSPDNSDTETNIGAALLQQGETDEAISHLKRAIEKSPDNAQAHINLGNAFLQKRDADSAIAEYRKTVELPFDHAESFYSIGNAYRQ
jgi:tetratricopeptide (TPR) repeat protein